eukprot:scaffold238015_cov60-Cyclotella_meneghiniana.AAC.1
MSVIQTLLGNCPEETNALVQCYGGNNAAMACTNCAWEELAALGVGCDVLEGSVDEAYTACAADCNAQCADDIGALKTCAIPLFCGEESTLKIA